MVQTVIPRAALRLLRDAARAWWYHVKLRQRGQIAEARKRERASVRSHLSMLREAIANDGFVTRGYGGVTLHINPHRKLEGYGDLREGVYGAAILCGLGWIDHKALPQTDERLWELVVKGPMPGFALDRFRDDGIESGFDRIPWREYAARAAAIGCAVGNVEEE